MNIDALPSVEREALKLLISCDNSFSQSLFSQLNHIVDIKRSETGCGVYVNFKFGKDVHFLDNADSFRISGVFAVSKKCGEIGFLLFIKNGLIDFLEAYTYETAYPSYSDCDFKLEKIVEKSNCSGEN